MGLFLKSTQFRDVCLSPTHYKCLFQWLTSPLFSSWVGEAAEALNAIDQLERTTQRHWLREPISRPLLNVTAISSQWAQRPRDVTTHPSQSETPLTSLLGHESESWRTWRCLCNHPPPTFAPEPHRTRFSLGFSVPHGWVFSWLFPLLSAHRRFPLVFTAAPSRWVCGNRTFHNNTFFHTIYNASFVQQASQFDFLQGFTEFLPLNHFLYRLDAKSADWQIGNRQPVAAGRNGRSHRHTLSMDQHQTLAQCSTIPNFRCLLPGHFFHQQKSFRKKPITNHSISVGFGREISFHAEARPRCHQGEILHFRIQIPPMNSDHRHFEKKELCMENDQVSGRVSKMSTQLMNIEICLFRMPRFQFSNPPCDNQSHFQSNPSQIIPSPRSDCNSGENQPQSLHTFA